MGFKLRFLFLFFLFPLFPLSAFAAPHSVTITFSESVAVDGYYVYRSQCSAPTAKTGGSVLGSTCTPSPTLLTTLASTATSYSDLTVTAGNSYEYYLIAFCNTGNSVCTGNSPQSQTFVATVAPTSATGVVVNSSH